MDTLPLETVRVIGEYLVEHNLDKYCMYNDDSRGLRLSCKFYFDGLQSLVNLQQGLCNDLETCATVSDMFSRNSSRPHGRRKPYDCGPYLRILEWDVSASKRCICQINESKCIRGPLDSGFGNIFYWRAEDSLAEFNKMDIAGMRDKCIDLLRQIEDNRNTEKTLLATSNFKNLDQLFQFQECMKRWGFKSDKMRVCARRQAFLFNTIVVYWQRDHENASCAIQPVQ